MRDWLGVDESQFYDAANFAIVPMGFCFPGYDAKGSDLPPPPVCARTWRPDALAMLPDAPFTDTSWSEWTAAVKEATGRKGRGLFMPLRKALTGINHGPDMGSLMPLLQKIKAKG